MNAINKEVRAESDDDDREPDAPSDETPPHDDELQKVEDEVAMVDPPLVKASDQYEPPENAQEAS